MVSMPDSIHILRDCAISLRENEHSEDPEVVLEGSYFETEDGKLIAHQLLRSFERFAEKVPSDMEMGRNVNSARDVRNEYFSNCYTGASIAWVRDARELLGWMTFTPDIERQGWWVAAFVENTEKDADGERPRLSKMYERAAQSEALYRVLRQPMSVETGMGAATVPTRYRWLMVQSGRDKNAFKKIVKEVGFHVWKKVDRRLYETDDRGRKMDPLDNKDGVPEMEHLILMRARIDELFEVPRQEGEAA